MGNVVRLTLLTLLVALLDPVTGAQPLSLAEGGALPSAVGWYEMPNTQLRPLCPPNGFGGSGYEFANNCWAVVAAWNSAVLDSARNQLIVWGGGHADYLGNEVYAVNLDTQTVQRLTDPGLPVVTSGCQEAIVAGTQPNSRHTYDGLTYMPHVDRMFVFGGSLSRCGFLGRGTWTLRLSDLAWEQKAPSGQIPRGDPGIVSAYDPNTGRVFLHDSASLYAYDYFANAYTQLTSFSPIDYHMTAAIDPMRKKFVVVGAGAVYVYDITAGGSYGRQILSTIDGSAIVNSFYPGLAYDPTRGQIVAWNGGDTVYSLNLDTRVWTPTTYSGGPGAAQANGTYKRWSYSPTSGVFVVVNSMNANVFALRLIPGPVAPPTAPTTLSVR